MKKIYIFSLIGLLLMLALPSRGADDRTKLDDNKLTYATENKTLWYEENTVSKDQDITSGKVNKFTGRYALVGAHCMINRSYTTVSVGSVTNHLDYLTDDTLTNHTTMMNVASVGVGYKPVVSVRDMEHHFAKGTTAGFCLASKSSSILSLDVGNTYVINFYREGQWVGMANAQMGKDIKGLSLKVVSVPSSDDAVYSIEASAPAEFDEVEFGIAGAATVDVASMVKLKYAFVGDDHMYTLTTRKSTKDENKSGIEDFWDYCTDNGIDVTKSANVTHDLSMFGLKDKVTNSDLTDGFTVIVPLAIGWGGGMSVWSYAAGVKGELFKKGSIVGFKLAQAGVDIKLLSGIRLDLLDKNGNTIKGAGHLLEGNLLGVNIDGGNNTISMEAEKDFSGVKINFLSTGLQLSGTKIYYAFVKDAPKLFPDAHHCPIEASADMNMCDYENSIKLYHNPDVPVEWKATKYPKTGPTINQSTQEVTGMNDDGTYVFTATSKLDNTCTETVTITRGDNTYTVDCENPIKSDDADLDETKEIGEYPTSGGGSLFSLSKWKDRKNILDGNDDTYAEYIEGAELLGNVGIITIKAKNGKTFRTLMKENATAGITDETEKKKKEEEIDKEDMYVGFVMEVPSTVLNLKLLQGFRIVCYRNGQSVSNHYVSNSNVLGLHLIGKNESQKLEVAITVPRDSDFDSFALWKTGTLSLNFSKIRIYYPFYERGSEVANCVNPLGCGATQISNSRTGAKVFTGGIDSNKTGSMSTADVASMIENLSFAVDDDPKYQTYVTIGGVANVIGKVQIGIKMGRTYGNRHRLAIVLDAPNNILDVGVGSFMTIKTYYKGKPTGDEKSDWEVLGLDLIKANDKAYYLMSPTKEYDEVMITFGEAAKVLDFHRLYGIAVQSDIDADGTPDCKDKNSCTRPQVQDVSMTPACHGKGATITWKGIKDKNYIISLPDQVTESFNGYLDTSTSSTSFSSELIKDDPNQYYLYTFTVPENILMNSGKDLQVLIEDQNKSVLATGYYTVHPLIARWKTDAPSTDWNEWSNWENGSPYECSDVVIPENAKQYPVLTEYDSNNTAITQENWNACNYIHFCPDAAVENIDKLKYTSAWVDLGLKNGIYRMFMAPLKSVKSGDLYVSDITEDKYFTALNNDNDPETSDRRLKPLVYQRLWDKCLAKQQWKLNDKGGLSQNNYNLISTDAASWSEAFNALSQDYSATSTYKDDWSSVDIAPDCFSLMVDNRNMDNASSESDKTYVIHLPKDGSRTYHYYTYDGTKEGNDVTVDHDATTDYKLWGNATWNNGITLHYLCDQSTSYEKTNNKGMASTFLVGNPMMSHLSIYPFITGNSSNKVSGVKVYDGNTIYSVIAVDNGLVSTGTNGDSPIYIGPSQAFFIQTSEALQAVQVDYKAAMYGSQPTSEEETYHSGNTAQESSAKALNNAESVPSYLRVKASDGQYNVSTLLMKDVSTKITTLIDEKYKPNLAAFSMEGNQAYDIRPMDADVIDLGFYTAKSDSIQLSFETSGNFDSDEWRLYDRATGNCYRLDETPVVSMEGANVGRFYLSRIGAVTGIKEATATDGVTLNVANGVATVTSDNDDLTAVYSYDDGGSLVDQKLLNNGRQATLHVAPGVDIVKVCRAGKADRTYKVMGR